MSPQAPVPYEVDFQRPWLGLASYTEENRAFFFGRTQEIEELFLRVRDFPLTVLYGQSGLGKTSLLGAGLMPRLREDGFNPIQIRLRFEAGAPPLETQLLSALTELLGERSRGATTLWEACHERGPDGLAHSSAAAGGIPVLVLDQFEEIFTLTTAAGRASGEAAESVGAAETPVPSAVACLGQLAELIENRVPEELQRQLLGDRRLARRYDFAGSPVRVLLALREDYLSHLEAWKSACPSVMRNRMALRPLNGEQALEAVVRPGRLGGAQLVSESVGARIVRFVANRRADIPLERIDAVPPLLSLVCRELNEERLRRGAAVLDADLVAGRSADILQEFYERSLGGVPKALRALVEDKLVTVGGHRTSLAREDAVHALQLAGLDQEAAEESIESLIAARLVSAEEHGGIQRLEITHDVLAPLVVRSRQQRAEQERAREDVERRQLEAQAAETAAAEARAQAELQRRALRRTRAVAGLFGVVALAAVVASYQAWRSQKRAEEATAQAKKAEEFSQQLLKEASVSDLATAQNLLQEGDFDKATIFIARSLWYDQSNQRARTALALAGATLGNGSFRFPLASPLEHGGPLRWADFSPDGTCIVTAGDDGLARLWETWTGKPKGSPLRHEKAIREAKFSPDSSTLLTASDDGTARLWLVATGQERFAPLKHGAAVLTACFSPDGARIATAGADQTARLWDAVTGAEIGTPLRHSKTVRLVSFSPDGTRLATGTDGGSAFLWNLGDPNQTPLVLRHTKVLRSASFSRDGRRLVTASDDGTARVWDTESGKPVGEPIPAAGVINFAAFSPDGSLVVTCAGDGIARLWHADTGKPASPPLIHEKSVRFADFSPDGLRVVTSSGDNSATIWEVDTGERLGAPFRHNRGMRFARFAPDSSRLLTASEDGTCNVWDARSGRRVEAIIAQNSPIRALVCSPDGTHALTLNADGVATIWDTRSLREVANTERQPEGLTAAAFSPDGSRFATVNPSGEVREWLTADASALGPVWKTSSSVSALAYSPDGHKLATAGSDGNVRFRNTKNAVPDSTILRHAAPVITLSFRDGGERLITASKDGCLHAWNLATGSESPSLNSGGDIVAGSFSPNGEALALSEGTSFRIWRRKAPDGAAAIPEPKDSESRLRRLSADALQRGAIAVKNPDTILCLAFSPDSEWVAAGCADGFVRLYCWRFTGAVAGTPLKVGSPVTSLAFAADGTLLACGDEGSVFQWRWDISQPTIDDMRALYGSLGQRRISFKNGQLFTTSIDDLKEDWTRATEHFRTRPDWLSIIESARESTPETVLGPDAHQTQREACTKLLTTRPAFWASSVLRWDPTHPLLPVAAAALEDNPQRRSFLVEHSERILKRHPELREAAEQMRSNLRIPSVQTTGN